MNSCALASPPSSRSFHEVVLPHCHRRGGLGGPLNGPNRPSPLRRSPCCLSLLLGLRHPLRCPISPQHKLTNRALPPPGNIGARPEDPARLPGAPEPGYGFQTPALFQALMPLLVHAGSITALAYFPFLATMVACSSACSDPTVTPHHLHRPGLGSRRNAASPSCKPLSFPEKPR